MEKMVIIGFGGHAKSIADCIEQSGKYEIVGYTDVQDNYCEYEYLGKDDRLQDIYNSGVRNAVIGIGYLGKGSAREKIYEYLKRIGYILPVISDPSSIISSKAIIEEGSFVGKRAVINAEAHIGKMCIINTGAIIEHECRIGDFTHVAVGATLCGQVKIGDACLVGANATIIQCMEVSEHTIVPAGYTVRK